MTQGGPGEPDQRAMPATDPEVLLRQVIDRAHGVRGEQARWELLLDAVVAMAADLSIDGLLERIVAVASQLAEASYAALGVLDAVGERRLRMFVHHGVDQETAARIGPLPEGHGILGVIIDDPAPLRLHDLSQHPGSFGFPADHPPMHSFLGVPVRTRDTVFGNLYLTEKHGGGDFTDEDERIVVALASAAGVAIENAQLYDDVRRRERWLAATAEITGLLLGPIYGESALGLVTDRARRVAGADAAWIETGAAAGAEAEVDGGTDPAGPDVTRRALSGERLAPTVVVRVPFDFDPDSPGHLVLAWSEQHAGQRRRLDPALPTAYAEQAALSLQVARSHVDRQRLAVFEDRDRIGRDLHDLVIQRLFAIGLSLEGVSRLAQAPDMQQRLESAVDDLDGTIRDIRATIFELGAPEDGADLRAEVSGLVRRAAATLKFRPTLSIQGPINSLVDGELGADVLAVLSESLSNASRHAYAASIDVLVAVAVAGTLVLEVSDDGRGIPPGTVESGLQNMRQRAIARGGTCDITSRPGGGTRVRWSVPLSSLPAQPQ